MGPLVRHNIVVVVLRLAGPGGHARREAPASSLKSVAPPPPRSAPPRAPPPRGPRHHANAELPHPTKSLPLPFPRPGRCHCPASSPKRSQSRRRRPGFASVCRSRCRFLLRRSPPSSLPRRALSKLEAASDHAPSNRRPSSTPSGAIAAIVLAHALVGPCLPRRPLPELLLLPERFLFPSASHRFGRADPERPPTPSSAPEPLAARQDVVPKLLRRSTLPSPGYFPR